MSVTPDTVRSDAEVRELAVREPDESKTALALDLHHLISPKSLHSVSRGQILHGILSRDAVSSEDIPQQYAFVFVRSKTLLFS